MIWPVLLLAGACAEGAKSKPTTSTVLALGDSIAFGYNPVSPKDDPSNFISYAQLFAEKRGSEIVNLGCGGETTGSLVQRGEPDNGCRDWRQKHPLHFDYAQEMPDVDPAEVSQLEVAVAYLRDPLQPTPEVITLDIGGNDLLLFSKQCPAGDSACLQGKVPELIATVLPQAQKNIERAFMTLRGIGGYDGPIVVLTTYALDYADPIATFALDDLAKVTRDTAAAYGVTIADGYAAFDRATSAGDACAAGLLYPLAAGGCDIHPSIPKVTTRSDGMSGAELLANTLTAAM